MTSRKNKDEISPFKRNKSKKDAKASKKEFDDPASKYEAEIQSCTIRENITGNDLIISSTSHRTVRKRKANENVTSKKTKMIKMKCRPKTRQESDAVSSPPSLDDVSDSGSVNISGKGSYLSERISPLSNNIRIIKKKNASKPCNKNVLPISNGKLHHLSFSEKPTSPVLCAPPVSIIPKSDMPVISSESNLDMPYSSFSLENILQESEMNMISRSSTSFDKVNPILEHSNTNTDLFLPDSSTYYSEQNISKSPLDYNNINPLYCDIITLLVSKLNEVKDSKENFICNHLKIEPIIKHEEFNYNANNAFNMALDFSTLKAASDYILSVSSGSDDSPKLLSDVRENSDTWQDFLGKSSGFTLDFVNFISGDSNELNSENVESAICANNCNAADIPPDMSNLICSESAQKIDENISCNLDNFTFENLNNVENFILSEGLNIDSNEISNENYQNLLCESLTLSNEDNEKSVKLCAKAKRRRKNFNWNHKKRKCENRISSPPKVNGVLNDVSSYTCDENEVIESIGLVSTDSCKSVILNSICSSKQSLTKKTKLKTVTKNKDIKENDKEIACMIKPKCVDVAKNTKGSLDSISQLSDEEAAFGKCDESEQFSKDQDKYLLENSTETSACTKISCYKNSQLSVDCNKFYSGEKCINPKLLSQSDNFEISKTSLSEKCNISYKDEENTVKLSLTAKGKKIKLLEGLIVGLEKLDQDTLSKYCSISNIEENRKKYNHPCTGNENNQITVDVGISGHSCLHSEDTLASFDSLQNEVQLHSSKEMCQEKNLNLKEHLNLPKKSKSVHKSKKEENKSTDLETCKLVKKDLKTNSIIKNSPEKLDILLTGNKKNSLEVLRSKNKTATCDIEINNSEKHSKADSSDTKLSFSNRKLNAESEQKLSNETVSKEKNLTEASELNGLLEKHSKSIDLSNVESTISGNESSFVAGKQDIAFLKSEKKKKGISDLVVNKCPKKHLKNDSTDKNISLHEKEREKISSKCKLQINKLKLGAEKNSCSEDLDMFDSIENNLQKNSSKLKAVSPGKQADISFKKNASFLESNTNTRIFSDAESNTHPENDTKCTSTSEKTITSLSEKTVILSKGTTHRFDSCLDYTVVNQNKKSKNNNDSSKKSKVKSLKDMGNASKIKISRKQVHEPSVSLLDLMTLSDTHNKESKNCKVKSSNKINKNVQNSPKKSVNKLGSRIILSKCNSNSVSKNFNTSNTDCNLSEENTNSDKVKSVKPKLKCSYKNKTEKGVSYINCGEDLKESSCESSYRKQTIDNSSNDRCSTSQTSYFENNTDDTLSLKFADKTSEAVILIDDEYLDFEPDQPDDLTIETMSENKNESLCSTTEVTNNVPVYNSDLTSNFLETLDSEERFSESSFTLKDNMIKDSDSTSPTNHCKSSTDPYNFVFTNFPTLAEKVLMSEEDTDSDDDHSFKRTRSERKDNDLNGPSLNYVDSNNCKESDAVQNEVLQNESELNAPNETCHTSVSSVNSSIRSESFKSSCEDQVVDCVNSGQINCLKSKESAGSVAHLSDVLSQIQDLCSKELFNEALTIANTYCAISSSEINQCILQKLLVSIFSFISKSDKINNSFKIFDGILNLIRQFNIYNHKIASYFITNCCSYEDLNIYSVKLFHVCHKENIPLDKKAIKALSLLLKSEEISFHVILDFMNYTKIICKKSISKELLHLALKKCETPTLAFSDIHHMCSLLHGVTPKEVEEHNLKDFILLCFKKNMWQHVAEMLIAWGTKNCLFLCIYSALTTDYKTMGKYFKKIANYVHEKDGSLSPELKNKLTPELKTRFGQMGTALMLNAFSKNYMDTALDILYILHTYNVNYFELQLTIDSFSLTQSSSEADNYSLKIFPFVVVFTAIDICIHLNRPKDAFTIFQDFSWVVPDECLDEAIKSYAIKEKYQRLLKLLPLLNNEDSLNEGWEALENLLAIVKQDLAYESFPESISDLVSVYNEYLVSLMNAKEISSVYILYQYSLGAQKDIFTIFPDVLRGLIVTFYEDGRDRVANSLFLLGVMKKIYPLQKPKLEHFPWEITLMTHWAITEIKVAVEWFIGVLFSLLMEKPKETHFEKWFSVKIVFDIKDQSSGDLKCLKNTISDPKYYITKAKQALENLNPSLEVTEDTDEDALYIVSNSLYNFWKSRCPEQTLKFITMDAEFVKLCDKFSFGSDGNYSKERESSVFVKTFLNETCNLSKSFDAMQEMHDSSTSLQSSPSSSKWDNSSATDVYEMIHEIKANTSALSCVDIAHEQNPSGQNSAHVLQSERFWFSCRNEENEINHTSERQLATISDANSSITNSETTNNGNFQTSFTPSSPCNSNKSPRTSTALCNSLSGSKSEESLPKNSGEESGKILHLETPIHNLHSPSVSKEGLNSFANFQHSAQLKKKLVRIQRKAIKNKASQPLISSKKSILPVKDSLLKSRTISVNKTPVRSQNKYVKFNNSSKKLKNFKICVTPCDRTVSSPISQSLPVESESVTNNLEESIFTAIQENSHSSFHEDVPVSNAPSKQALPVVSKTVHSDIKMMTTNFTDAGSDMLLSCKVSDSKEHKQELNALPISSQTTLKLTKSPVQSVNSSPKSKFIKTLNLKNISNPKSSDVSVSTSLQNCKTNKPKSKPVIKRNSTCCSSLNKTSTSVSQTIHNKVKRITTNFVDAGSDTSSSGKVSDMYPDSNATLVKLPVSNIKDHKQESDELPITPNTTSKLTKSPVQSVDFQMKNKFVKTINLKNTSSDNMDSVASCSGGSLMTFDRSEKITTVKQNFKGKELLTNCNPVTGSFTWNHDEFKKATQFLKSQVAFKNKSLSLQDQNKRVLSLFQAFIKNNEGITKLDKRTMKLLTEFAHAHV